MSYKKKEHTTDRTESSGSDPFVQPDLKQLSHESAVSMRMHGTDSKQLHRRLEEEVKRKSLSVSAEGAAEKESHGF